MNPTPTRNRPALRSWRLPGATLCALALAAASPGVAAQAASGHAGHGAAPAAAAASAEWAEAEVRRIDAANGRVTLRHGPIRSLDMPPMTMVFQVSEATLLGNIKAGDKVRFSAEKIGGAYTVTAIEVLR